MELGPTVNSENAKGGRTVVEDYKPGQRVKWNTPQGETSGVVVEKLTSEIKIEGHKVAASKEDPQWLVESEKTGRRAAHKPDALTPDG